MMNRLRLLWFLLVSFVSSHEGPIDNTKGILWTPPSKRFWKTAQIEQSVKIYWEGIWSKAFYAKDCSGENDLKIIPIYYWTGERVDLTCRMCHIAFLMNGRIKRWGFAEEIDEFLYNPTQFTRVKELWVNVRDVGEHTKMEKMYTAKEISHPFKEKTNARFWQHDGVLTIFNADTSNQGVYFCYDDDSKQATNYYYVLMAMTPPVKFHANPAFYNDECGNTDERFIAPSFNWRFHFLPEGNIYPPPTCQLDKECLTSFDFLNPKYWPASIIKDMCDEQRCRARLFASKPIDMYIEIRWDDWTSCEGDQPTKRREAHCYVMKGDQDLSITTLEDEDLYKWVKSLETTLNTKPFDTMGIRLHSSLIATSIMDIPRIMKCQDSEKDRYELFDKVWRSVFMRTFGIMNEDGEPMKSGEEMHGHYMNPFLACFRYRSIDDVEHLYGTFSTQVDYC